MRKFSESLDTALIRCSDQRAGSAEPGEINRARRVAGSHSLTITTVMTSDGTGILYVVQLNTGAGTGTRVPGIP